MEVKLFVYDKNLLPDNFCNLFKIDKVKYSPCFVMGKLLHFNYGHILFTKRRNMKNRIVFGTLYELDIDEITFKEIELYYTASEYKVLEDISCNCIAFNDFKDIINQNWEVVGKCEAKVFAANEEKAGHIFENRHIDAYNFAKEFVLAYR